jgi:hypothetical protein
MKTDLVSPAVVLIIALAQLVFFGGAQWFQLRQVRRDVNGLGQKFGRVTALLVRQADTPEKREQVAKVIEGGR